MKKTVVIILLSALCCSTYAKPNWHTWVNQIRQEALAQGISEYTFDRAFDGLTPMRRVISLDRKQPEKRLTYLKYRKTRASTYRISLGKKKYRKHKSLLDKIGAQFGVDPCYIVSLWGMESSYGHYMGHFPVIRALATLAYDTRRADFFKKELFLALHILDQGHISLPKFKGEWAGASGHPQFLPSSWHHFAVDYDQDGRKDIWGTYADVFASIANYLVKNGWQTDKEWGYEVEVPNTIDHSLVGYEHERTLSEWAALGIRQANGDPLPHTDEMASLLEPYGGPKLLALKNFRVILRYNRSTYYAGAITYMAEKICHRR